MYIHLYSPIIANLGNILIVSWDCPFNALQPIWHQIKLLYTNVYI
jgi:hypothetical protein